MTSEDSHKSICSPESASGPLPHDAQAGATIAPCGPAPARARRLAAPESLKPAQAAVAQTLSRMLDELAISYVVYAADNGLPMNGTFGPKCGGSYETSGRWSSAESKLRALTDAYGSTLYEHRWKCWSMILGPSISAHRASARRTSDKDCTGWPTPLLSDTRSGVNNRAIRETNRDRGPRMADVVMLSGWPTPCSQDGPNGGPSQGTDRLPGAASLTGWRTPTAQSPNSLRGNGQDPSKRLAQGHTVNLTDEVTLCGWSTPTSRDHKDSFGMAETGINPDGSVRQRNDRVALQANLAGWPTTTAMDGRRGEHYDPMAPNVTLNMAVQRASNGPARRTATGEMLTGLAAGTKSGGQLSPRHSLWLMLGPIAIVWLNCAERVTRLTSRKPKALSGRS